MDAALGPITQDAGDPYEEGNASVHPFHDSKNMPYKTPEDKKAHQRRYDKSEARLASRARCEKTVKRQEWRGRYALAPAAREKRRRARLRWTLLHRYGLSPQDKIDMAAQQGNACCICRRPFSASLRDAFVDHDHKKARGRDAVRALLCRYCNTALGHVGEDPDILRYLIDYLDRFR